LEQAAIINNQDLSSEFRLILKFLYILQQRNTLWICILGKKMQLNNKDHTRETDFTTKPKLTFTE
jgi:hypothetical protein